MWPPGAGEMARRVREHAWHETQLGPTESWPASLRSIVDMVLSSGFAMVALWGRDLISIYNDAYADLIGPKHPDALGRAHARSLARVLAGGRARHRTGVGR